MPDTESERYADDERVDDLINQLADAVSEALDFFVARDEMNAHVHRAEPRWSPITEQMREALAAWREYRYPPLREGA